MARIVPLSDALNWGLMIDPRTIVTKSGSFLSCLTYMPPSSVATSADQHVGWRAARNRALMEFNCSRWALWFCQSRRDLVDCDSLHETPTLAARLENSRRRLFSQPGHQLTDRFVIGLQYSPLPDEIGRVTDLFDESTKSSNPVERRYRRELETFRSAISSLINDLADFVPHIGFLEGDELVSHLHARISTNNSPIVMPCLPSFLSEHLTDDRFVGGIYPRLGSHHLRTVRIKDQPEFLGPHATEKIGALNFPFDHVVRWIPLSDDDASSELLRRRGAWNSRITSFVQKIMNEVSRAPKDPDDLAAKKNLDAKSRRDGLNVAISLLNAGKVGFGFWSHTVTVTHPDIDVVDERINAIKSAFRAFVVSVAEDDAEDCWLGSIPGHPHCDLGRFLGPTMALASVMPASAPWVGPEKDYHLDAPALLRCRTDGHTGFNLALHQPGSDVGHFIVWGETGAGKSTLLKRMMVAHRQYAGSKVYYIDRGAVAKLAVLALGGAYLDLSSVSLQPLAFIDRLDEWAWSNTFIQALCRQEGLDVSPRQKQEIEYALTSLASQPQRLRTLSHLRLAVQDDAVKDAISPFCMGGAAGHLLDHDRADVLDLDVRGYDVDRLLNNQVAVAPVVSCIMHEIARSYEDARPTLVIVDEAKAFISHPLIVDHMDELIRRARRENLAIGLATHSILDVEQSQIGAIIKSSVKNRIFTANSEAGEPAMVDALLRIGLLPNQIETIARLRPKRDYAQSCQSGFGTFELCLTDEERAFVCGGSGEESKLIDRIYSAGPADSFVDRWLAHKGLGDVPLLAAE